MMAKPHRLIALWALLQLASGEGEFEVHFEVARLDGNASGAFTVRVHPDWAPLGARRFAELVKEDYFDDVRFFRVIDDFVAQLGVSGNLETAAKWSKLKLKDDPNKVSNTRGRVGFTTDGLGNRTMQLFINLQDNSYLDEKGFSPFAEVVEGIDVVDKLYSGYGEGEPNGNGPSQNSKKFDYNEYLKESFPKLSFVVSTQMVAHDGELVDRPLPPDVKMESFGFLVVFVVLLTVYFRWPKRQKEEHSVQAGIRHEEPDHVHKDGAVPRKRVLEDIV